MKLPKTSKEAAKMVSAKAKIEGISLTAYCLKRGVSSAVVYNWAVRDGGFNGVIFWKLMSDVSAPRLEDKQTRGTLRK